MIRHLLLLSTLASPFLLQAQTQIDPTTQIKWPQATGSGAPTIPCTVANYGQPYTDTSVNPNVQYMCGSHGWANSAAAGVNGVPISPSSVFKNYNFATGVNGAVCNDSTDDTSALNTLLSSIYTAGGGQITVTGTCLISGAVLLPNNGNSSTPTQPSIRITGSGSSYNGYWTAPPTSASTLDMRYNASIAKIDTRGAGTLEIDHLTLIDGGSDCAPFVQTTNTSIKVHDVVFSGTHSGQSSCNDAIILGGTTETIGNASNDAFQGYGTSVNNNFFAQIRRGVHLRTYANGVVIRDNTWSISCGAPDNTMGAIDFSADPSIILGGEVSGNLFEVQYYPVTIRLQETGEVTFTGNSAYDGGAATQNFYYFDADSWGNMVYEGSPSTGVWPGTEYLDLNTSTTRPANQIISSQGVSSWNSVAAKDTLINIAPDSNNFAAPSWYNVNVALTSKAVANPVNGVLDAWNAVTSTSGNQLEFLAPVTPKTTYTYSVYMKNNGGALPVLYEVYDLTHASVLQEGVYTTAVNSSWQRLSQTFTVPDGTTSVAVSAIFNSASVANVYIYGAQLNSGLTATPYNQNPSTASSLGGTFSTADNNAGLFQPMNLMAQSNNFAASPWSSVQLTITPGAATGPTGLTDATQITTSFNAANFLAQGDFTVLPLTTYTYSYWALNNGGTATRSVIIDATHSAYLSPYFYVTPTATWTQYSYTFTTAAGTISIGVYQVFNVDSTVNYYIWGAQLNLGSSPTPYIGTGATSIVGGVGAVASPWSYHNIGVSFGNGIPFGNLAGQGNASIVWCPDCDAPVTEGITCTSAGAKAGAEAHYIRGVWLCF